MFRIWVVLAFGGSLELGHGFGSPVFQVAQQICGLPPFRASGSGLDYGLGFGGLRFGIRV